MPLSEKWASPEDFATLFQYFWHRDFPIDQKAIGAHRADWTIHIGIVVRNVSDTMGLWARFEHGSRKDALLRSTDGDEIAIEWEWKDTWHEELIKLKNHTVYSNKKDNIRLLKYGVLITYATDEKIENMYKKIQETWKTASWPLLLIVIEFERYRRYSSRRKFKNLHTSIFERNNQKKLFTVPALPWHVIGSRWSIEHIGEWE
jgi:hypothetical protein